VVTQPDIVWQRGVRRPGDQYPGLAALVVVLEAIQQLFQPQTNRITYRGTAEALRPLVEHHARSPRGLPAADRRMTVTVWQQVHQWSRQHSTCRRVAGRRVSGCHGRSSSISA
jgi:hypothetical protein